MRFVDEAEVSSSAFRQAVRFVDEAEVSSSASTAAGIAKRQSLGRAPLQTLPSSAQALAYPIERLLAIADRPRSTVSSVRSILCNSN